MVTRRGGFRREAWALAMGVRDLVYGVYEQRLAAGLDVDRTPKHIGVILDGNRRWAKAYGETVATGHQRGADKIHELLGWCEETGIGVVTLWLLSTDNFNRPPEELAALTVIISNVAQSLAETGRWRINPVGALDLLPQELSTALKECAAGTSGIDGIIVNVAVGYGGRREIADAVRSLLYDQAEKGLTIEDLAQVIDIDHIAEHLYTKGQPDPDLVLRTSGEQRLGGFLLWQSAHSEFYFCEAYWPAFRKIDFLRALRDFSRRQRRFGA
jgi:short-chain Z-isoprenyl diphosphate synthase